MPIGNNAGLQNNVLVLEVVMVTKDVATGEDTVLTLGVHPFAVGPSDIRYVDQTRSTVRQTQGSAVLTKGGRALRQVSLSGTFGVEERGFGPYVGTGAQRFARMWHEVVRLADAVTKEQVKAELDPIRSPILAAVLKVGSLDMDRTTFTVNLFDFWHSVQFEALVQSFSFGKSFRAAAATGNTQYSMQLQEVGPIVTGGFTNSLVRALFQSLKVWDTMNETIRSYTTTGIADAIVAGGNVPIAQFADSVSAFSAQVDGATAVLNGYADPTRTVLQARTNALLGAEPSATIATPDDDPENGTSPLTSHLGHASGIVSTGSALLEQLLVQGPPLRVDGFVGAIPWSDLEDEGGLSGLDAADRIEALVSVIEAAQFQSATGALYGMSREDYAAYLSASGAAGPNQSAGTIEHIVRDVDTAAGLEQKYGVSFDAILRANGLLPDDALVNGQRLLIPQTSGGSPPRIDDLPTFGSHAGSAAWGSDLWIDLRTNDDGRPLLCTGEDVLVQGIDWIIEANEGDLLQLANELPTGASERLVEKRIAALVGSDARIVSVDAVVQDGGGSGEVALLYSVQATAINGGSVAAGSTG